MCETFLKAEWYCIVCVCNILFICSSIDTCVASTFWLLRIMLLWTLVYKYFFQSLLSFSFGIYPEVGRLDHRVILVENFWGTAMFSIVAVPFYSQLYTRAAISLHPYQHLYFVSFVLIVAIVMGVRWSSTLKVLFWATWFLRSLWNLLSVSVVIRCFLPYLKNVFRCFSAVRLWSASLSCLEFIKLLHSVSLGLSSNLKKKIGHYLFIFLCDKKKMLYSG